MALTFASSIELFLYALFLLLFMIFFGIPSVEKYQREETVFVSSRKLTNGFQAPALTFIVVNNKTKYGWKTETNQTSSLDGRYSFTFLLDHCKEINQTDLEACIDGDSLGLTDFLSTATFQMLASSIGKLNTSAWTEDIDVTANGKHFTWVPRRQISPKMEDFIYMAAYKNFHFHIFVHDINFYFINTNPFGPTKAFWNFDGNSMSNHYQEIALVTYRRLNLDHQPCEEAGDYSFNTCVRESLAEQIGCRRPWDRWSRQDRAICTERDQFMQFDMQYTTLQITEIEEIERSTGCLKPCTYNEYKIVNSSPKKMVLAAVPDDQIAIGLLAVSQYTQFEEEVNQIITGRKNGRG